MPYIIAPLEKSKLRRIFSRVAKDYDIYASLQKKIAQRLVTRVCQKVLEPESVLDIGMGTGWLAKNLSLRYPQSKVFGVDFAEGMVTFASKDKGRCSFAVADAESLPFREGSFELAVSNLTYQWADNLESAFAEIFRVLRKNSRFYITCFGCNSLQELKVSLDIQENRLPDKELIYESLSDANFKNIKVTSYIEREFYDDIFALVRWLKKIGANRIARPPFMGRKIWEQANRVYLSNYRHNRGIFASFEVIWAEGLKE